MASKKERIDVLLVDQGFFPSREKAKAAIMAGLVFADQERIEKAGMKVDETVTFVVKGALHPYVSRGGLKLKKAIDLFHIDMKDRVVLDIGASTGGFSDCALQHGAQYIYAIDVGTNQLDWKIRQDERVQVMEKTNFRYVKAEAITGPQPDFATMDVSFISLKLILPTLRELLSPGSGAVALIKPQFEAGREKVGKSGVVRDPVVHRDVLNTILSFANTQGFQCQGLTYSPITGGEGNIEFLAYFIYDDELESSLEQVLNQIPTVVEEASQQLM